jgi:hypothetical protein
MNLVYKKIDGFPSFPPSFNMVMYFFAGFAQSHPVSDQTQGSGAVIFLIYR